MQQLQVNAVKDVQTQRIIEYWSPLLDEENDMERWVQRVKCLESELSKLKQQSNCSTGQSTTFDPKLLEATASEESQVKEWLTNEVKLPQYFEALKDDGFDDMESVQDVTEDDLKAIGIDKTGHRRKILKYAAKWRTMNNF